MEPQQQPHRLRSSHPHLSHIHPPAPQEEFPRSAHSTTPSPGLFSLLTLRAANMSPSVSEDTTPDLHPLQSHKVRETHKATKETDYMTGRKLINHYEIIDELGRGMHGKVKLARNLETGENVAIKIIPRFSKKRRLGKIMTTANQDKSKREIAILKKIRHANVVALLEVIDDPELKKIYMVLEHVELGEVVWRKKGVPKISEYERRRIEREMHGKQLTPEEEAWDRSFEHKQARRNVKRLRMETFQRTDFWSLEFSAVDDDVESDSRSVPRDGSHHTSRSRRPRSTPESDAGSRAASKEPSRAHSVESLHSARWPSRAGTPQIPEPELPPTLDEDVLASPGPPEPDSAPEGTMYGFHADDATSRARSPSMADSIISHMSSVDYIRGHDPYADDFSYVPCFNSETARATFRDTVLGLEYLHYEGVVHRDIKPANLLWTKDHRVKISDFGVSYFGRPIRDGEPDDAVSESEARDFDNDLELAKTVGTPAFFAPELCFTDALDSKMRSPKVTEQIDVWSLGVTLYCLVFARIPFLAEDEWQMFRKIATEDVYIPMKRLKAVDPLTQPSDSSLFARVNRQLYRNDDELLYEDVEPELRDLLNKMLTKNPEKRIRLRDVKRHPWVIKDIEDVVAWLDDTDPSKRTSGRRIQVDEREIVRAVVPISILARVRSSVKKVVGKVIPHMDRADSSSSRNRATSSAASSSAEGLNHTGPATLHARDLWRPSLRSDDCAAGSICSHAASEHPLTRSVTASPDDSACEEGSASGTQRLRASVGRRSARRVSDVAGHGFNAGEDADSEAAPSKEENILHESDHQSVANKFVSMTLHPRESATVPPSPAAPFEGDRDDPASTLRKCRHMKQMTVESSRARSVDRGLFSSDDKRAGAMVSVTTAMAPGNVLPSRGGLQTMRSDLMRGFDGSPTPFASPSPPATAPPAQPVAASPFGLRSDPIIDGSQRPAVEADERRLTTRRILDLLDARIPLARAHISSFTRAKAQMHRRQVREREDQAKRQQLLETSIAAGDGPEATRDPCLPSPDDHLLMPGSVSRHDVTASSAASVGVMATPMVSLSVTTSPVCKSMPTMAYRSDPSLPALLSGASSVSADPEGDFLNNPGVVGRPSMADTTDSLTPPALAKEPITEFPLEMHKQQEQEEHGAVASEFSGCSAQESRQSELPTQLHFGHDEGSDTDSDGGLVMHKPRKAVLPADRPSSQWSFGTSKRRDTNTSAGSTDTAKRVVNG